MRAPKTARGTAASCAVCTACATRSRTLRAPSSAASAASWSPTSACWRSSTRLQRAGELPPSVVWKISVMLAPSNPLAMRELERIGASTVNVPSDMSVDTVARNARGDDAADRPVRRVTGRARRRRARRRTGRPRACRRTAVREVRPPQLAGALPLRPPPRGRGLRDRAREGASRCGRARVVQSLEPGLVQSAPGAEGLGVPQPETAGSVR